MSISEIVVKIIGGVVAIFGVKILFESVTGLPETWVVSLVGLVCLAGGIYIVRGGNFQP